MSVQRRTTKRADGSTLIRWRVRWKEGSRWPSRTFDRAADARLFDGDLRRRRRLGPALASLDNGTETLDTYVTDVWAPTYAVALAAKTRSLYTMLYDHHISPTLGDVPLRELTPEVIGRWQADRLAAGGGPSSVRKALTLLGGILQRAAESGRIPANPARLVRKTVVPRRPEVRPLAPGTVEAMRAASSDRNAALIAVLAYAGLRPGEALALRWGDVRDRTLLVERALSLGEEKDTKTTAHRTVRLLAPLAVDLKAWQMRSGRPSDRALVFPGREGKPWTEAAYQSWRGQAFARAAVAAGIELRSPTPKPGTAAKPRKRRRPPGPNARPYDLRHTFASLLLYEGRSVIYVARQLGHGAALTLSTYGHVIDELEDAPRVDADTAIIAARQLLGAVENDLRVVRPSAGRP
jgi:integrase